MKITTAATLLLVTTTAHADNPNAEALFYQAKSFMAQRKFVEACAAYEASEKLKPAPATLVSLADCREKNQQLASAYQVYLQVERELRERDDEGSIEMRGFAKLRAVKLEPRVSKLTVTVPPSAQIAGLEVLRGNDRIDATAWNQPLLVDGGTFRISARAPDRREWSTTVTLKTEGDVQRIDVPALGQREVERPTVAAATPPAEEVEEPVETSAESPSLWRTHKLSLGLGATAVALAAGAMGFELSSRSIYERSEDAADPSTQERYWHSANRRRYIAGGFGVAALGCAGAAVYLFVRERRTEQSIATRIVPVAGHDTAGISLGGSW